MMIIRQANRSLAQEILRAQQDQKTLGPLAYTLVQPRDCIRASEVSPEEFDRLWATNVSGQKWLLTHDPETLETVAIHPRVGIEVPYRLGAPDVAPVSWQSWPMYRDIPPWIFFYGTMAHHYYKKQREIDRERRKKARAQRKKDLS